MGLYGAPNGRRLGQPCRGPGPCQPGENSPVHRRSPAQLLPLLGFLDRLLQGVVERHRLGADELGQIGPFVAELCEPRTVVANTALAKARLGQCRLQRLFATHDGLGEFRGIGEDGARVGKALAGYPVIPIYGLLFPFKFLWLRPQHRHRHRLLPVRQIPPMNIGGEHEHCRVFAVEGPDFRNHLGDLAGGAQRDHGTLGCHPTREAGRVCMER